MPIITHPLDPRDRAPLAKLRELTAGTRGMFGRPEGRARYDELLLQTPVAAGVVYDEARIGGVAGWWCRPADAQPGAALLHLHGGGFVVGTARAYRPFAGQIAARAGVASFVPDYRLTPEHPFPAAVEDVAAAYAELAERFAAVFVIGDSAGGNLALSLAGSRPSRAPRGVIGLSPWTDLAITGDSIAACAEADLYLTPAGLRTSAARYLGAHDPRDPRASPLYGDLAGLPPTLIHVGGDEILLDDSRRYGERHPSCTVHVWDGMPHVFPASLELFQAAPPALAIVGELVRSLM